MLAARNSTSARWALRNITFQNIDACFLHQICVIAAILLLNANVAVKCELVGVYHASGYSVWYASDANGPDNYTTRNLTPRGVKSAPVVGVIYVRHSALSRWTVNVGRAMLTSRHLRRHANKINNPLYNFIKNMLNRCWSGSTEIYLYSSNACTQTLSRHSHSPRISWCNTSKTYVNTFSSSQVSVWTQLVEKHNLG